MSTASACSRSRECGCSRPERRPCRGVEGSHDGEAFAPTVPRITGRKETRPQEGHRISRAFGAASEACPDSDGVARRLGDMSSVRHRRGEPERLNIDSSCIAQEKYRRWRGPRPRTWTPLRWIGKVPESNGTGRLPHWDAANRPQPSSGATSSQQPPTPSGEDACNGTPAWVGAHQKQRTLMTRPRCLCCARSLRPATFSRPLNV